jgi:hypothetical protein
MRNSYKNLLRTHGDNCNKILVEWSILVGSRDHWTQFWKGPSNDHSTKVWWQLAQWFLKRRFLCEFPIGSYVKLSSAVGAILVEGPNRRTHFWKRTIHLSVYFYQKLTIHLSVYFNQKLTIHLSVYFNQKLTRCVLFLTLLLDFHTYSVIA